MSVTKNAKFCPWKLTSCPRQSKKNDREKRKVAVTTSEILQNCPWQFLISARDKTKSSRDKPVIFLRNFRSQAKIAGYFFPGKSSLVIQSFKTLIFFSHGENYNFFFVPQENFIRHSFKIRWGFNYFIKTYVFFETVFLFFFLGKLHMSFFHLISESFFSSVKKKNSFFRSINIVK